MLPCEREWDRDPNFKAGGAWYCINDHTGCLYNDGHNTCCYEGNDPSPLSDQDIVDFFDLTFKTEIYT